MQVSVSLYSMQNVSTAVVNHKDRRDILSIKYSLVKHCASFSSVQGQRLTGVQSINVLESSYKACEMQMRGRKMPPIMRRALI